MKSGQKVGETSSIRENINFWKSLPRTFEFEYPPLCISSIITKFYERPFTDTHVVVTSVILLTFLVLGLFGNVLTIVVITTNPALKNVFMTFITSLCVSDLWSAMISWLCLYRRTWGFDVWAPLPGVFCRIYWASDLTTSYATALHVLSYAWMRFVAVQYPLQFTKIKIKHVKIWIILLWSAAFIFGFIPFFIFCDATYRNRFGSSPDAKWPSCTITMTWYEPYLVYQIVFYSLFFFAPTIGILIVSILIGVAVMTRTPKMGTQKKKKQILAVTQLVLIVMSFLIGYIPFTAYEFWSVQPRLNTEYNRKIDYWFGMIQYILLRFSETLNPVFYNLGSTKMRHYTVKFLKQKIFCCQPSTTKTLPKRSYKPSSSKDNCCQKTNKLRALKQRSRKLSPQSRPSLYLHQHLPVGSIV